MACPQSVGKLSAREAVNFKNTGVGQDPKDTQLPIRPATSLHWASSYLCSCNTIFFCITLRAMTFPRRAPSRALLSQLRGSPCLRTTALRSAASRQIRCESDKKGPLEPNIGGLSGKSFKGQLYESTATRLAKERLEQERFSKSRDEGNGPRNMYVTFGMFPG